MSRTLCVVALALALALAGCSNVSPWCTGHGDCQGQPVRMQWRNQSNFQTATADRCSNHGEIYVR